MNLFDKHSPAGFVIACQCGVDDFLTIEEAEKEGWTELFDEADGFGDGFGWDYIGVCPECVEIEKAKGE